MELDGGSARAWLALGRAHCAAARWAEARDALECAVQRSAPANDDDDRGDGVADVGAAVERLLSRAESAQRERRTGCGLALSFR